MGYINWVGLIIGITAGMTLSNLLGENGLNIQYLNPISIAILGLCFLFIVIYRFIIRRGRIEASDERIQAIEDRAARNGFLATFLGLFGLIIYRDIIGLKLILDTGMLVALISVGYFVFLASLIFQLYIKNRA